MAASRRRPRRSPPCAGSGCPSSAAAGRCSRRCRRRACWIRVVGRRGPDAARRRAVLERVLAPVAFHDDRRVELLRLAGRRRTSRRSCRSSVRAPRRTRGRCCRDSPSCRRRAARACRRRRRPCRRPGSARPSAGCSSGRRETPRRGLSTFQRSSPVAASRQYIQPPVSAKYTAPSATSAEEKMPASDAALAQLVGDRLALRRRQHRLAGGIAVDPEQLAVRRRACRRRGMWRCRSRPRRRRPSASRARRRSSPSSPPRGTATSRRAARRSPGRASSPRD